MRLLSFLAVQAVLTTAAAAASEAPGLVGSIFEDDAARAETGENAIVTDTVEEPLPTPELRLGAFRLRPEIELGLVATDNVGQATKGKTGATGFRMAPALDLQSEWPRHLLRVMARGEEFSYPDEPASERSNGSLEGRVRLDVRRSTTFDLLFAANRNETASGEKEVPASALDPRIDQSFGGSASLNHDFGPIGARMESSVSRSLFGDVELSAGGTEDNGDRDYIQVGQKFEVASMSGAILQPFASIGMSRRVHDDGRDRSGTDRDSTGLEARIGLAIDDAVWEGRVGVSWERRVPDDPDLEGSSVVGLLADLSWRPTRATRLNLRAETGFDDSTLEHVTGYRTQTLALEATHALSDRLVAEAHAAMEWSHAIGPAADAFAWSGGIKASYDLSRTLAWITAYEFRRDVERGPDMTENRLTTGILISPWQDGQRPAR